MLRNGVEVEKQTIGVMKYDKAYSHNATLAKASSAGFSTHLKLIFLHLISPNRHFNRLCKRTEKDVVSHEMFLIQTDILIW